MAGSTNILAWNPSAANQESGATYLTDTLRTGGATPDAILPSALDNKFRYNIGNVVVALCAAMAAKGYVIDDTQLAGGGLQAVMANVLTNADLTASIQSVSFASSIAFNAALGLAFDLTLTGNVTSSTLTGIARGNALTFIIAQDATGGRTFSWPTGVKGAGTPSLVASSVNIQQFIVRYDGSTIDPLGPMTTLLTSGIIVRQPSLSVPTISSSGTVANSYNEIIELVNATGGAITRTLFDAVAGINQKVVIKKTDASTNSVTIACQSAQTIDGNTTLVVNAQNEAVEMVSNGTNWFII